MCLVYKVNTRDKSCLGTQAHVREMYRTEEWSEFAISRQTNTNARHKNVSILRWDEPEEMSRVGKAVPEMQW